MDTAARRRLGDIFVERGLISEDQLRHALAYQGETGGRLGEILVELGFITRIALAGVITEQWDELRLTERSRKTAEAQARRTTVAAATPSPSVAETALRARLEALTHELAERDRRIAQQDATIAALLSRLAPAAA